MADHLRRMALIQRLVKALDLVPVGLEALGIWGLEQESRGEEDDSKQKVL